MPRELEFRNLVVRFGSSVLADYADEIVFPAFTGRRVRNYGSNFYRFIEVEFVTAASGEECIVGRFVKNSTLSREQIYDEEKGLRRDKRTLKTSPTSIFVLIIDTHKLLYYREFGNSPNVDEFVTTLRKFLFSARDDYIDQELKSLPDEERDDDLSRSRGDIAGQIDVPFVSAIPLPAEGKIAEALAQFSILQSFTVKFALTNNEIDNDEFFEEVRVKRDQIGAKGATLTYSDAKNGLTKDAAESEIVKASETANAEVKLRGRDNAGSKLSVTNEEFRLKVSVNEPDSLPQAVETFVGTYNNLVDTGEIKPAAAVVSTKRRQK